MHKDWVYSKFTTIFAKGDFDLIFMFWHIYFSFQKWKMMLRPADSVSNYFSNRGYDKGDLYYIVKDTRSITYFLCPHKTETKTFKLDMRLHYHKYYVKSILCMEYYDIIIQYGIPMMSGDHSLDSIPFNLKNTNSCLQCIPILWFNILCL